MRSLARLRFYTTPGLLTGIRMRKWGRLLAENRLQISPRFWGRALMISLHSLVNSSVGAVEDLVYGRRIEASRVEPPVFILGVSRSGTTHLQKLLGVDPRFAFPSFFAVQYPHIFLLTERLLSKLLSFALPAPRAQDEVRVGWQSPAEDEIAIGSMTLQSGLIGFVFPRSFDRYVRYRTFEEASDEERSAWKAALLRFLKKLTLRHGRPLILKSPVHTCRIRMLNELFPDARFVHIHRNPYDVLASQRHTLLSVLPLWQLQVAELEAIDEMALREYSETCRAFFEQRPLIAEERFHELRFEDLERDPIAAVERIYERLGLGDFESVRAAMRDRVASGSDYQKGEHSELPPLLKDRLRRECPGSFDEWGYPR